MLYGEIAFVPLAPLTQVFGLSLGPEPVVRMGLVTVVTAVMILIFYKELLVSSFDPGLAASLGINAGVMHYALMSMLSVVVVSAFESVGAILVIAMLILPGATATLHLPAAPDGAPPQCAARRAQLAPWAFISPSGWNAPWPRPWS